MWEKMSKKILVTGGAGFIGSHLVDSLVEKGYDVRILDNLEEQVHQGKIPAYLNKKAEFLKGDVRNKSDLEKALDGVEIVFHEAAAVGVGQSMYQIRNYIDINNVGTANLLDFLVNEKNSVKKIIVAASMSSYGEGLYKCEKCNELIEPELRDEKDIKSGNWELNCKKCNSSLKPIATPETKTRKSNSIYALSKLDQEEMVLMIGKTYGINAVSLRYFNVFGTRQSLSNPYTGVSAIFMSRIKNSNPPVIYEDGLQTRDFISVKDIASANITAMESNASNFESFNVGSGNPVTIKSVAETLIELHKSNVGPEITKKFRKGDVRHCFADNSKIKSKLGWKPEVSFREGLKEIIEWSATVKAEDKFEQAAKELREKGLA